jgi:hypothetical protein
MSTVLAKIAASAAVGAAGAFAVYFVAKAQPDAASVAVTASAFGISACMSPIMSRMAGLARGVARYGFAVVAIGFTLMDAFGMARGYVEMQKAPLEILYGAEVKAYEEAVAPDKALIAETTATISSLAPPVSTDTYTSRIEAAAAAYEKQVKTLQGVIDQAEARIAKLEKPMRGELPADLFLVAFLASLGIQTLIALSFVSIGLLEGKKPEAANDDVPATGYAYKTVRKARGLDLLLYGKKAA